MTCQAPLHVHLQTRADERMFHLSHSTVAGGAIQFAKSYMTPVRKIGVVGDPVHLPPRDLLLSFHITGNSPRAWILSFRVNVTNAADLNVRNESSLTCLGVRVTVSAGNLQVPHMDLVAIGEGLRKFWQIAAAQREAHCRQNEPAQNSERISFTFEQFRPPFSRFAAFGLQMARHSPILSSSVCRAPL